MKHKQIYYKIKIANKKYTIPCMNLSKISWPIWWSKNEKLGKRHILNCINEKRCLIAITNANHDIIAFLVWGNLWNKIHLQDIFVKKNIVEQDLVQN